MVAVNVNPSWFFGIDVALELVFFVITLFVGIASYKIYKISKEKSMRCFSISFFLIAFSYLVWAVMNLFAIANLQESPTEFSIQKIFTLGIIGIYIHMILLSIGLITLAYATLPKRNSRVYYLMLGLGLIAIVASTNKIITFRIISVFLLSSIIYHFFIQWKESKNNNVLYSLIAFSLLLISNLEFALSENYYMAYVIGHIFELLAYSIILRNLVKLIFNSKSSNEQKKNKT